ncbi:MAG: 50S ribosomal protein L29 [Actinobacteria bacterium]|nr:50S ribosomal protein L29 [Actinomycetota bacterium]MDI6816032.1 50S ribosomal protein L29 [Actinomycetota bacterium]MDP2212093.1 50S ribosomal protein L29 [Candidatus Aquicultor sp.]HCG98965.1 50S ribosomal protein L29 [Actinomycetota bacterium]
MKAEKYRDLTDDELVQKLKDAKEELFNLRFQLATGQLDNPMKIKDAKRDIARIQTVRMEREIEAKIAAS